MLHFPTLCSLLKTYTHVLLLWNLEVAQQRERQEKDEDRIKWLRQEDLKESAQNFCAITEHGMKQGSKS